MVARMTTLPRHCTWCHMDTVTRVTPTSRPCTWGHTYTVSKVSPSQILTLESHIHSLQNDSSKILYLRLHVYSLQGFPTLKSLYLGSHIQSPG